MKESRVDQTLLINGFKKMIEKTNTLLIEKMLILVPIKTTCGKNKFLLFLNPSCIYDKKQQKHCDLFLFDPTIPCKRKVEDVVMENTNENATIKFIVKCITNKICNEMNNSTLTTEAYEEYIVIKCAQSDLKINECGFHMISVLKKVMEFSHKFINNLKKSNCVNVSNIDAERLKNSFSRENTKYNCGKRELTNIRKQFVTLYQDLYLHQQQSIKNWLNDYKNEKM